MALSSGNGSLCLEAGQCLLSVCGQDQQQFLDSSLCCGTWSAASSPCIQHSGNPHHYFSICLYCSEKTIYLSRGGTEADDSADLYLSLKDSPTPFAMEAQASANPTSHGSITEPEALTLATSQSKPFKIPDVHNFLYTRAGKRDLAKVEKFLWHKMWRWRVWCCANHLLEIGICFNRSSNIKKKKKEKGK